MAIHGLDYTERNWFVCADDPGKRDTLEESRREGATIFFHSAIPNAIMTEIQDNQSSHTIRALSAGDSSGMEQVMNQRTTARNRDCFRFAVKAWENFAFPNGSPILLSFEKVMRAGKVYDVVSEQCLNAVHISTINEVGSEIFSRNSMDEDKRKKLGAVLSALDGSKAGTADNAADKINMSEDATEKQGSEKSKNSKPSAKKRGSKTTTKPDLVTTEGSQTTLNTLSG